MKSYTEIVRAALTTAQRIAVADYKHKYVCTEYYGEDGYMTVEEAIDAGLTWAWAVEPQAWPTFDAEEIVRTRTEDGAYVEDAHDRFKIAELQELLDTWLASHGKSPFFTVDNTRIVVLKETSEAFQW